MSRLFNIFGEKVTISLIFPEIMSCYCQSRNPKGISRHNDHGTGLA